MSRWMPGLWRFAGGIGVVASILTTDRELSLFWLILGLLASIKGDLAAVEVEFEAWRKL